MACSPGSFAQRLYRAFAVALGFAVLAALRAEEPPKSSAKAPAVETGKPANRTLDPTKLPPGSVIIVSDNPRDALQNVDAVVISTEEYKKLLDAAEQAKQLATPDKPEPPSVCRLSGRIETRGAQEVAVLQAQFQFRTTGPRATVLLGLQRGRPTGATIDDGRLAVLQRLKDEDGYCVLVEAPGDHRVTVDLEAPLTGRGTKGGERGIDLGLPGAAITRIERLELPTGVTRVRVAGRTLPAEQLTAANDPAHAVVIGPVSRLDLTWEGPTPAANTDPLVSAEGRYEVRVDERVITTKARLTLKVLGGTVGEWRILATPMAEVTPEAGPGASDSLRVERPRDPNKAVWTISREPSADGLAVEIYSKTDILPGKPVAVPVFPVLGASQQSGTLTVGGPPHLRLMFKPTGDLSRREGPEESSRDAVFSYYRLPESGTPLEIDVQPARGEIEAQANFQFALAERGWRWQGKFDVRPVRTEVAALELDVPAELQELRPASAELVESVSPVRELEGGRRLVRVQLAESRRRSFSFILEGLYPVNGATGMAALPQPRLLGVLDRGGVVSATAPAGLELRGSLREWERDRPGDWERPLDPVPRGTPGLVATVDRAPARIDLSWRSPRSDLAVSATVDVQLGERQATVRHQWRMPTGPAAPRQVTVRGPATLAGRLRAEAGGVLTPSGAGEWTVQLPPTTGRDHTLTLAYSFTLPVAEPPRGYTDAGTPPARPPVTVPLVWLDPGQRCETTIRIWAGVTPTGSLLPVLAEGPWTELPTQVVPDYPSLPTLVLHGSGPGLPLSLHLTDGSPGPGTSLVVERVWVQALVDEDGQQAYRTRCLVRPQHVHFLDVELPAPPAAVQFAALLNGKRLNWQTVETRTARLRLEPDPGRYPQTLELTYLVLHGRSGIARGSRWQVTLVPPRLRGLVFIGPLRWQVGMASGDLAVSLDDDLDFEQRWDWRRGLFGPQPAWTAAALQRWFFTDARPPASEADPTDGLETTLVAWQPAPEPLRFLVVSRPLALLVGSLAVVALGLAAACWARPRGRLVGAVVLAGVLTWFGVTYPQPLTVLLHASQPGLAVLVIVLGARWLLQRRYRRQVLFLPGLAYQQNSGSSSARGSGNRASREPTTIDAPAAH